MVTTPPSNLNPNSAPWGRWVTERLLTIISDATRTKADQTTTNKMLNSSINALSQQVNRAPLGISSTVSDTTQLAPPSSTLTQMLLSQFSVPQSKTYVTVFSIANAQYLDRTSAGAAFAEGRVGIRLRNTGTGAATDWVYSITARAAKDAGASAVINVINPALSASFSTNGYDLVEVSFEASVSNTAAFSGTTASNQTQLSTNLTFTA